MGIFGSKPEADLFRGQQSIHKVISKVMEVAIARTNDFALADQPQLTLKNNKGKDVTVPYSALLNYVHHAWLIIEEHHWHEEQLMFPALKHTAPDALLAIEVSVVLLQTAVFFALFELLSSEIIWPSFDTDILNELNRKLN